MGVESRLFVIPGRRAFRPAPERLAALVDALRRGGWIADPAAPGFKAMAFGGTTTSVHASATGAMVRRLAAHKDPTRLLPLPAGDLGSFFAGIAREERRLTWPVQHLAGAPVRWPLDTPSALGPEAYFDLELWLSDHYVDAGSEVIDPLEDHTCGLCRGDLTLEQEGRTGSLFHFGRLARACPTCGAPFDPTGRAATWRDPETGDPSPLPGGCVFRFALVIDCGKNYPACHYRLDPVLLSLLESVLGEPFESIIDFY